MRAAWIALLLSAAAAAQAPEGYIYRANENAFWLSKTDPDYRHAPPEAVERWKDWKFGLRIHWGPYSMVARISEILFMLSYPIAWCEAAE